MTDASQEELRASLRADVDRRWPELVDRVWGLDAGDALRIDNLLQGDPWQLMHAMTHDAELRATVQAMARLAFDEALTGHNTAFEELRSRGAI